MGLNNIKRILRLLAVLMPMSSGADQPVVARTIRISTAEDLAFANEIETSIHNVSTSVTVCVGSGQDVKSCQCKNAGAVMKLKQTTDKVLKQRPAWNADDVVLYWETKGKPGEPPIIGHNVATGRIVKFAAQSVADCKLPVETTRPDATHD